MRTQSIAGVPDEARQVYVTALDCLDRSGMPYLVGGAYAMREYANIMRHTKDLDVFCKASDYNRVLRVLAGAGFKTEVTDASWLAKAFIGEHFIDLIFNSANGLCPVDDTWFEEAHGSTLFDRSVPLIPPEEEIWTKVSVQDRYRFDGADVLHIVRKVGQNLDWARLLRRCEPIWELLLAHLMTFRFVYPSERDAIPRWVLEDLLARVEDQMHVPVPHDRICRGPLLSRTQYQVDIEQWGYIPK